MALQVQNGYLVLLMDIGSGISTVVSDKSVSDNNWYKATIERYRSTIVFIATRSDIDSTILLLLMFL